MAKPNYTNYQTNSINQIMTMFDSTSRVFLADEAGLGKTVTAAGVMDKLYTKEFLNNEGYMYVFYVAPSAFIADNACDKLIGKSMYEDKIYKVQKKDKLDRLTSYFICNKSVGTDLWDTEIKKKVPDKRIILVPLSSENLGGYANKKKEVENIQKSYKYVAEKFFEEDCGRRIEFMKKSKEIEDSLSEFEKFPNNLFRATASRYDIELAALCKISPALVIWDEFHRYNSLMQGKNAIFDWEKHSNIPTNQINIKCCSLFLSATPYHSNIGGENKATLSMEYEDELASDDKLPSFDEFAQLCVKGWHAESNSTEYLSDRASDYVRCLADFTLISSEDEWEILKKAKEKLENQLKTLTIRHERTQMAGYKKEQFKNVFDIDSIFDENNQGELKEEYKDVLVKSWNYSNKIKKAGAKIAAIHWALNMPYILSFSTKNGASADKFECLKSLKIKDLYLSSKEEERGDQIASIYTNTLQFHEIIKSNIDKDRNMLLWVPPSFRYYDPGEDSVFEKNKAYSKLLIFAENTCFQRGIPYLLSQYTKWMNKSSLTFTDVNLDSYKDSGLEKIEWLEAIKRRELDNSIKLQDLYKCVKDVLDKNYNEVTEEMIYATIASPYVCAKRIGLDDAVSEKIESAFKDYFVEEPVKAVITKWKEKYYEKQDWSYNTTVLRYCCEGNLLSVLEEWYFSNPKGFSAENIDKTLSYMNATVKIKPLLWDDEQGEIQGEEENCRFAIRLTSDKDDNGTSGTGKNDSREELSKVL